MASRRRCSPLETAWHGASRAGNWLGRGDTGTEFVHCQKLAPARLKLPQGQFPPRGECAQQTLHLTDSPALRSREVERGTIAVVTHEAVLHAASTPLHQPCFDFWRGLAEVRDKMLGRGLNRCRRCAFFAASIRFL